MTRRKGRQLSWRWCWESLVEFSRYGATALLFLECFQDVLLGRCERVLSVSHLQGKDRRYTLLRTHTFVESDVNRIHGLAERLDTSQWINWLKVLESPAGKARQQQLEFVQMLIVESYRRLTASESVRG